MNDKNDAVLRKAPLFANLSEGERRGLLARVSNKHFRPGESLFNEGDPCSGLFLIAAGKVRIFKMSPAGREQILAVEGPGDSFAELPVFDGGDYPASAAALEDTEALFISRKDFQNYCRDHPDVALKVIAVVGSRLRHLVEIIEDLSFNTVRRRLISLLLRLAEQGGTATKRGIRVELTKSHQDIAAELGTVRLRENNERTDLRDAQWMIAPLSELTWHIRKQHHRCVREAIPRAQALLDEVIAKHGKGHPEVIDIRRIFGELGKEMILHMRKEEQILFPYIDSLERAIDEDESLELPFFQTVKNPIQAMMNEHDASGESMRKIRKLSHEYTAPADACATFKASYEALKQFETDLHQHVHLENNILFPCAMETEAAVINEERARAVCLL